MGKKCEVKLIHLIIASKFWERKGRPVKVRRLEVEETIKKSKKRSSGSQYRLRRQQMIVSCRACRVFGHNARKCLEKVDL